MLEIFLGLYAAFSTTPDLQMVHASALTRNGQYEASENVLKDVKPAKTKNPNFYYYCRLINNFSLNHKSESEKYVKLIGDSFNKNLSERHEALVYLMAEELKTWKQDDLSDIARDMKHSGTRLDQARPGQETQKVQKDIITKLDKLIKQKEDEIKKAQEQASKGQGEQQPGGQGKGQGQMPQQDSIGGQDSGPGKVDQKKLKNLAQNWGKMPEKERAKAMMELTRELPPRYRQVIEDYFKTLAKNQDKPN